MAIRKSVDEVLKIKPVYVHLIHRYPYMGPCRFGQGEQLERAYDEMMAEENFQKMQDILQELYGSDRRFQLLKPAYLPQLDEFICREEELDSVGDDIHQADVILMEGLMGQHLAVNLAKRFRKPMVAVGCCTSTDVTACLRAAGFEAYGCWLLETSKALMEFLRAKKGIQKTRVLSVLKGDVISKGVESNIRDFDRITNQWGVTFKFVNAEDFLDEIGNLSPEEVETAEKTADALMAGAESCTVSRDDMIRSAKVYVAAKKMLDLFDCNAFTIPCFEICATRRLNEERYTFCLTHSLLKEEGIPSACEFDANSALSMQALIAVSGQSPYMGNTSPLPYENGGFMPLAGLSEERKAALLADPKNLYYMHHSVPHRCMRRPDEREPYGLNHFAYEQKFGAVLRYDFERDRGQVVTVCRFSPDGEKMLIGRGEIVGGDGFQMPNCRTTVIFRVKDQEDFYRKQLEVGNHCALVFGDYTRELAALAEVLGVEALMA